MSINPDEYVAGKLYQWDGQQFVELPPSEDKKIAVTPQAFERTRQIRAKLKRPRPDLYVVASAMLIAAAEDPNILARARAYAAELYGELADSLKS